MYEIKGNMPKACLKDVENIKHSVFTMQFNYMYSEQFYIIGYTK